MEKPKRVAAIHDLSSFGRCALSVIMPTISAMGIQVCPIPTALLSTHTGGFTDMAACSCDDFPAMTRAHWETYDIEIDCIYSGYLGHPGQTRQILDFKGWRPNTLLIVDPVMGDDGALYSGISPQFVDEIRKLCHAADLITPNATEAALLLGTEYSGMPLPRNLWRKYLSRLSFDGKTDVIVTGCPVEGLGICNLGYAAGDFPFCVPCNYINGSYPGTGDIFTSVLTGGLLKGLPLLESAKLATEFTEHCISLTVESGQPARDGVFLEYALPALFHLESHRGAVTL